ncbi:MAG: redoxin domain-containing protein [Saprospiraceae bacterium]|nr:redoxin domain-containing protein [Saprospiraceae bacterium]
MVNRQNLSLIKTNKGNSIAALSDQSPVLLVFLRHFGCVFCKDSMHEIAKKKEKLVKEGIKIVLVHMSDYKTATGYFKKFNIQDLEQVSDIDCKYYGAFGLVKGSFSQLFGLKTWIRGFEIATTKQMLPGLVRIGDGLQMPGIFLIKDGIVIESFIHNSVADKPNYDSFIEVCHL